MSTTNKRNIKMGLELVMEKTGLDRVKRELTDLSVNVKFKGDTSQISKEMKDAGIAASKLGDILDEAWNAKIGQLDLSKVRKEIQNTWGSASQLKKILVNGGQEGAHAYNYFASEVLRTNIQLKQSNKLLDDFAESLGNTVKWGISSSVFNTFASTFEKALGFVTDLDSSLNDIRIVAEKSAEDMERFAVSANKAAKTLGASTRDYTEASLIYYQQGDNDEEAAKKAEVTLKAANVTGQSGQEVSEQLTAVWNGYKVTAGEAELYIDKLAAVAAATASDLEELSTGMSKVASAANIMGVDVDQLNATLATVVSVTRQAPESVGTAFKTIYSRMGDIEAGLDAETTLGSYTKQMKEIAGINVLDANGHLREMGEVIEEVGSMWSTLSKEQQVALSQVMAGTRQYNNLLALFDNWDMYTDALETSANAAGTLNKQQDIYMESTEAHLQRLKTEAEETYNTLFDTDAINSTVDAFTNLLSVLNTFLGSFGGGMQTINSLIAISAQLFHNQIGKALETFTENKEAKRNNADAEKLKEEIIANHAASGEFIGVVNNESLEKEIEYAKRLLDVKDMLSDQEAQDMIDQQKQIGLLAERVEGVKNYMAIAQEMGEKNYIEKDLAQDEVTEDTFKEGLKAIQEEQDELTELIGLVNEYNNAKDVVLNKDKVDTRPQIDLDDPAGKIKDPLADPNIKKQYDAQNKSLEKQSKIRKTLGKYINDLYKKQSKGTATKDEVKHLQNLVKIQKKFNETQKLSKDDKAELLAYTKSMQKENDRDVLKMRQGLQGVKDQQNDLNVELEKELNARERLLQKQLEQKERAKQYAAAVKGTTALINGLVGAANIINIISDEDISLLEKGKQVLAATALYLPIVIKNWSAISAVWKGSVATLLPLNVQMALTTAGAKLQSVAVGLLTKAMGFLSTSAGTAAAANGGFTVTSYLAAVGAKVLEKAVKALNKAFETGPLTALVSLIIKAIVIIATLTFGIVKLVQAIDQGYVKSLEKAAKADKAQAELMSQQADKAKELASKYSELKTKVQELTDQYESGVISATRYKEAVYALAKQYGLANGEISDLLKNEQDLQKTMDELAIKKNQEAIDALDKEEKAHDSAIKSSLKKEIKTNENYKHRMDNFGETIDLKGMVTRNDQEKALAKELEALDPDLFKNKDHIKIDNFADLLAKDPDKLREILLKYQDTQAGEQLLSYVNAEDVKSSTDEGKTAGDEKKELQKTNIGLTHGKEKNITDLASYEKARDAMVKEALEKEVFTGDKANEEAEKWAEAYLTGLSDNVARLGAQADWKEDLVAFGKIPQAGYSEEDVNKLTDSQLAGLKEIQGKEFAEKFDELKGEGYSASEALAIMAQSYDKAGEAGDDFRDTVVDIDDALKDQLSELDTTEEELETYTRQLLKNNKSLNGNVDLAKEMALINIKMNKGVADLSENYEDLSGVLKKGDKDSAEYAKALNEMHGIMENLLNIEDGAQLSESFYTSTKNLDLMKKAAEGDTQAILDLREAAGDDIIAQVAARADTESAKQALSQIDKAVDEFPIKNLEVGAEVDFDMEGGLAQLNELVRASGMTAEEVQSYFNSMGYDPEVETETITQKTTHHGAYPKYESDGTVTIVPYTWETEDDIQVPKITSLKYTGSDNIDFSNTKAGKKGSGGGQKSKVEKTKGEKDRYHDVNIQLKQIENNLESVREAQERLVGEDLINNLAEQYKLLNQQLDKTAEKIKIAEGEASELQAKLAAKGVTFNADGTIANYAAAYDQQLAALNAIEDRYDRMSEDQRKNYQETYDKAKEDWEEFLETIENYDTLLTDTIPEMEQSLTEMINEQIGLKIDAFHHEIELRLEMAEAERDWNEFFNKVIKDIDEEDILGNAEAKLKDFMSYYKDTLEGVVQVNTTHINDILADLKAMDEGLDAKIYSKDGVDNRAQALEDLQKYYEQLMEDLEAVHDLSDEIRESYVDMIDEAQEKFDEQISTFETINSLLEHDKNVISMIYGEESYSTLSQFYDRQEENYNKQLDFQKQQVEFWKQQMATAEEGSDAWNAAKENWLSAVDAWNAAIETAIENLQDKYLNAINAIFQALNDKATGGMGLGYVETEWDLINQNADQYLDTVNAIYKVQELQNKYLDAIEKSSSPTQQKKLNDLMQQETDYLREQDKLSEYDLERANLKYEIALKQMALEDAQQNKSKLRLRRDSQGNYTYQYTQDDDQIASIQSEIADLYNQLYNLDADAYKGNLEEIFSIWQEFQERMSEAAQINDPEQRAAKELLIKEQYSDLINGLVEKNENLQANMYQSTMSHLFDLYNQNTENYDSMSEDQKAILDQFISAETDLNNAAFDNLFDLYNVNIEQFTQMTEEQKDILMDSMVPQWNSGVQQMIDKIAGEGGFAGVCKDAFEELDKATEDYMAGLEELQKSADVSFEEVKEGIDEVIVDTETLLENNDELIDSYGKELEAIQSVIDQLDDLIAKYDDARIAAEEATRAAYEYWQQEQNKNAQADTEIDNQPEDTPSTVSETPQTTPAPEPAKPSLNYGSYVEVKSGTRWYANSYGGGSSGAARSGKISYINLNGSHPYNIGGLGWIKKTDIVGYDTGGYTGDWNSGDGRLAMLHKKELVLNAHDTDNMLNAITILRDLTANLGASLINKMASITSGNIGTIGQGMPGAGLEQSVVINAEFPNATSAREIEDAINNLVNRASQHITK